MIINEWKRIRIVKFLSVGCIFAVITWEWCGNYTHNAHRRWFKSADSYHDHCVVHELYDTWKELLIRRGKLYLWEHYFNTCWASKRWHCFAKEIRFKSHKNFKKRIFQREISERNIKFLTDYLLEGKIIYIYIDFSNTNELKISINVQSYFIITYIEILKNYFHLFYFLSFYPQTRVK